MIWWGSHTIPIGECGRWRIGPSLIWIQRMPWEWRIASRPAGDGDEMTSHVEVPIDDPPDLLEMDHVVRLGISRDDVDIEIAPRLADRPVVTRPLKPFHLPPRESATVFVGSPLWMVVSVAGELLYELPVERPADTWFGPPTDAGELCYASRTACRLRRTEVADHPHRALSMVEVRNLADSAFILERMQLPVDYLELYLASDGEVWSQDVVLERVADDAPAPMTIRAGAPEHAGDGPRLADAREQSHGNVLVGAFNRLFRS